MNKRKIKIESLQVVQFLTCLPICFFVSVRASWWEWQEMIHAGFCSEVAELAAKVNTPFVLIPDVGLHDCNLNFVINDWRDSLRANYSVLNVVVENVIATCFDAPLHATPSSWMLTSTWLRIQDGYLLGHQHHTSEGNKVACFMLKISPKWILQRLFVQFQGVSRSWLISRSWLCSSAYLTLCTFSVICLINIGDWRGSMSITFEGPCLKSKASSNWNILSAIALKSLTTSYYVMSTNNYNDSCTKKKNRLEQSTAWSWTMEKRESEQLEAE